MNDTLNHEADNLFDTWELYKKIVSYNNMFHKEIYTDVAAVLSAIPPAFSFLDLGCGDAVNLAPILAKLPIAGYCGVDLSETALGLARQNLQTLPCPVQLRHDDLLQTFADMDDLYDVAFTSFALHHLSYAQKADFFKAAHSHLKPKGVLLMIDTVRAEHENLADYLAAYCRWLREDWQGINAMEKDIACQHIVENDFPETLATLQDFAKLAGFVDCQLISQYQWHYVLRFSR
jgi:cyclopropane fatty-acyl-phospholipid synthase-like methyltransferase